MTVTGLGISNQEHLYNRYEVSTNKQGVGGGGGGGSTLGLNNTSRKVSGTAGI